MVTADLMSYNVLPMAAGGNRPPNKPFHLTEGLAPYGRSVPRR